MTSVLHLHIADISLSLQFRQLDEETVTDYAYALSQGAELPDVQVAFDREKSTYYMVDGFHRLEAQKRHKATMVTASVTEMSKQDARWLALGANAKNGRRLSVEDKRVAIALALKEFPNASSRSIAAHLGCSHTTVLRFKESGGADVPPAPTPLLEAESTEETADSRRQTTAEDADTAVSDIDECEYEDIQDEDDDNPSRVVGLDGKSYPAKQDKTDKSKPMTSFGELAASLPYSLTEETAAQAVIDAVYALPSTLTIRTHEGRLIITSTDSDKPTLRDCPLQRGADWERFPIKPFFKFSATDFELLDNNEIETVGDLSELVMGKKTISGFGKRKLENLEEQFERFWEQNPELCYNT